MAVVLMDVASIHCLIPTLDRLGANDPQGRPTLWEGEKSRVEKYDSVWLL